MFRRVPLATSISTNLSGNARGIELSELLLETTTSIYMSREDNLHDASVVSI
jgi:hypothetical protein